MIEIQDLKGKNQLEIIDLIIEQKSELIEIYVPKSTALFFSERAAVAKDYVSLAYAGHLLNKACKSLSYNKVGPELHQSVLFSVEINDDIESFAKALFEISFGYVNSNEDAKYRFDDVKDDEDFDILADQYIADVQAGIIQPVCKYFCEVAIEFLD